MIASAERASAFILEWRNFSGVIAGKRYTVSRGDATRSGPRFLRAIPVGHMAWKKEIGAGRPLALFISSATYTLNWLITG